MSQEFSSFKIWEAKNIEENTYEQSDYKFENTDQIQLDYCIARNYTKRQTDTTGVESVDGNYPDTGPAAAFIDIQLTILRTESTPAFINNLLRWYYQIQTAIPFIRGNLGLENTDNPFLNVVPVANKGYKLSEFKQVTAQDYKGKQMYLITLQRCGVL